MENLNRVVVDWIACYWQEAMKQLVGLGTVGWLFECCFEGCCFEGCCLFAKQCCFEGVFAGSGWEFLLYLHLIEMSLC